MKQLSIDRSTFKRGAMITSRHLYAVGACDSQIRKFRKEWPDGVRLLKKNIMRAAEIGLDICWLVGELKYRKLIPALRNDTRRIRRAMDKWKTAQKGEDRINQKAYYKAGAEALWRAISNG
jgi:hypothetical protein